MHLSLASFGVVVIIFGLTRPGPPARGMVGAMGFSRMTASWPFNLLLLYFMTTLGVRVVAEMPHHLRRYRAAAVMTHLGVFVLLVAAPSAAARCAAWSRRMWGEPVNVGRDDAGHEVMLPFALTLDDFSMEEYRETHLLDTRREKSSREFLSVEAEGAEAVIDGWRIRADHTLDMAGHVPGESAWRAMNHIGAARPCMCRPRMWQRANSSADG